MVGPDDYASCIEQCLSSGDRDIQSIGAQAKRLFGDPSLAPPRDVADKRDLIERDVCATFPTPFATAFETWMQKRRAFAEGDSDDEDDYASRFGASFDGIWACWLQIVHFLPFIFLVSLTRLPDMLRERGGPTLVRAFKYYDKYYRVAEGESETSKEQSESQQRQLLQVLIEFCSQLSKPPGLPDSFFLNPLLGKSRDFTALFPKRFAAQLGFLQLTRNRVVHGKAGKRGPNLLRPAHCLIDAAFLDVVSVLTELSRAYGLYYVSRIDESVTPAQADAWSFTGLQGSPARFRTSTGGAGVADVDKFVPRRIYMIDRARELGRDPDAPALEPPDYIDLTPFLVELGRFDATADARQLRLYGLSEYRSADKNRFIWFLELAGRTTKRLPLAQDPTDYERRELAELVPELERMGILVEDLEDYNLPQQPGSMDFAILRRRAWDRVSRHHLESVVDVRRYDYRGLDVAADAGPEVVAYERDLFSAPTQARDVAQFFASETRGLLLVGGSGYGKTTLLAHSYLERLRAGDFALFLSGRKLSKPSLRDSIDDAVSKIQPAWKPKDVAEFIAIENRIRSRDERTPAQIAIFIDAINEYTSGGGAVELLRELLDFVETGGEQIFTKAPATLRVVASCRSEAWHGFLEAQGSKALLNPANFYAVGTGDPVTVSGFDDDASRRALFAKYQAFYRFTPVSYDDLSPVVTDLFRNPLMLALVAQTYGQPAGGEAGGRIPSDLNYYALFSRLKDRKLADATYLIPAGDRRSHFPDELRECLFTFARVQYERMTAPDAPRDYVRNSLTATGPIAPFKNDRPDRQLTAFRALLEIGLIATKRVPERDYNKNETTGTAFTFFHDRYAEYELATVYSEIVLKELTKEVVRDQRRLEEMAEGIGRLVRLGVAFPALAGAVEHWFHLNLVANDGKVASLIPLCNRLVASESAAVRTVASACLTGFVVRGAVEPKKLYEAVFSAGTATLRIDLASAYGDAWPGITADAVRAFINACDPKRDELVIEALAAVFAEHANAGRHDSGGASAIAFVADVLPDFAWGELFTADGFRRLDQLKSHLAFLVQFCLSVIVTNNDRASTLLELRDFLRARFRPLIDILLGKPTGNPVTDFIPTRVRGFFRERFERIMYIGWEDAISSDGVNDRFFTDDGTGYVQRDALGRYLPYMCAVHNGDYAGMSLEPGTEFRELSLEMLNYRKYSMVGFAAYTVVSIGLRDDERAVRDFAVELTRNGSPAGRFVAVNIIEAYSILHPSFGMQALEIVDSDMLPELLDDPDALPHLLVCGGGIVEDDVDERWPHFQPSLDTAFAHLAARGDAGAMLAFGRELRCMTFSNEIRLGTRLIEYLLEAGYLDDFSPWRAVTLEICAGMLARRRTELVRIFKQYGVPESVLREAEQLKTQEVFKQQRTFGARARWNRFLLKTIAFNTKLRYLLIKHMLGFLTLCNELSDWATQMGTFMIEGIRVYARDDADPQSYERLTVEDVYATTTIRPKAGGGKVYVPRRKP